MNQSSSLKNTFLILLARALFFTFFIYALDRLIILGTNPLWVSISSLIGLLTATYLSRKTLSTKAFVFLAIIIIPLYRFFLSLIYALPTLSENIFQTYAFCQHLSLLAFSFWLTSVSTWFFWRCKHTLTFEIIIICTAFIIMLASHHQYHFEELTFINSLAWKLGFSQLQMLIIVIAAITTAICAYSLLASTPYNSNIPQKEQVVLHQSSSSKLIASIILAVFTLILYLTCQQVLNYHNKLSSSRIKNGVAESNEEGLSPLDFHSGLGISSQPVAIVRLDNDYRENPTSPMIYFRESTVSDYDGNSMIIGDHNIDNDVPFTTPNQVFTNTSDIAYEERIPVEQSIYLLTKHENAFALDYPLNIKLLKVPEKSDKFKGAYKAYSMAPAFSRNSLSQRKVGNPAWDDNIKNYYVNTTADVRYKNLAEKITAGLTQPIDKINAIINYLNTNVIYTLNPQQEIRDGEDPISTFLFGDMRGYCVHFAYAITYLLRSLNIPTRIATGYACDLSQSKDGHILVRMNDRHAWAEVYIDKLGWIPFDLEPQHVESHAETPIDMEMLEELMNDLGPDEEILPEELTEDEKSFKQKSTYSLPSLNSLLFFSLILLGTLIIIKLYAMYAWYLPAKPATKLKRGYRAVITRLSDLGIRRFYGETRQEFSDRLQKQYKELAIIPLLSRLNYDKSSTWLTTDKASSAIKQDIKTLYLVPLKKRIAAFFNIISVINFIGGSKW